jgi:hypothetical protein
MKQKFLESKYRDDIVTFAAMILVAVDRSPSDALIFLAGAFFSFMPRIISLFYGVDGRSKAERARAVALFCLYFFLLLWSTDLRDASIGSVVSWFLFGAAFYQMILHLAIRMAGEAKSSTVLTPRSNRVRRFAGFLLAFLTFAAIRYMVGEGLHESVRHIYPVIVGSLIMSMMQGSKRTELN